MNRAFGDLPQENCGYVLLGEIPFACKVTSVIKPKKEAISFVGLVSLLESVGKKGVRTKDLATTYFKIGTLLTVRWDREAHPTDGLPCFRVIGPLEFARAMGMNPDEWKK
jgi:hypothetical protein